MRHPSVLRAVDLNPVVTAHGCGCCLQAVSILLRLLVVAWSGSRTVSGQQRLRYGRGGVLLAKQQSYLMLRAAAGRGSSMGGCVQAQRQQECTGHCPPGPLGVRRSHGTRHVQSVVNATFLQRVSGHAFSWFWPGIESISDKIAFNAMITCCKTCDVQADQASH